MARAASSGTSPIGSAGLAGTDEATLAEGADPSVTLPHAWHSPQRPTQRGVVHPHSVQR